MSTLRSEIIDRVYAECADFAERNGISEEAACRIADTVGWSLVDELDMLLRYEMHPVFLVMPDGTCQVAANSGPPPTDQPFLRRADLMLERVLVYERA